MYILRWFFGKTVLESSKYFSFISNEEQVEEKDLNDNTLLEETIDNSITSSEAFENIYDPGK